MISSNEPKKSVRDEVFSQQRSPTPQCWQMWERLDSKLIELDEFLGHWQLSRAELARLCHCSLDTVDRWFVAGRRHRPPTEIHKRFLGQAHALWSKATS
jgi:hypothetical protein